MKNKHVLHLRFNTKTLEVYRLHVNITYTHMQREVKYMSLLPLLPKTGKWVHITP